MFYSHFILNISYTLFYSLLLIFLYKIHLKGSMNNWFIIFWHLSQPNKLLVVTNIEERSYCGTNCATILARPNNMIKTCMLKCIQCTLANATHPPIRLSYFCRVISHKQGKKNIMTNPQIAPVYLMTVPIYG